MWFLNDLKFQMNKNNEHRTRNRIRTRFFQLSVRRDDHFTNSDVRRQSQKYRPEKLILFLNIVSLKLDTLSSAMFNSYVILFIVRILSSSKYQSQTQPLRC